MFYVGDISILLEREAEGGQGASEVIEDEDLRYHGSRGGDAEHQHVLALDLFRK